MAEALMKGSFRGWKNKRVCEKSREPFFYWTNVVLLTIAAAVLARMGIICCFVGS